MSEEKKENVEEIDNNLEKDATTGEIWGYSCSSLSSQIGALFAFQFPMIIMLVLKIDPILVGLVMTIRLIWDAITDPIMANITDNFHSKWGRRRPFILVGGVMLPIVCILSVYFLPKNDKILLNNPIIPKVAESNKKLSELGKLITIYGNDKKSLFVKDSENKSQNKLPHPLNETIKDSLGILKKTSLGAVSIAKENDKSDLIIYADNVTLGSDYNEKGKYTDYNMNLNLTLKDNVNKNDVKKSSSIKFLETPVKEEEKKLTWKEKIKYFFVDKDVKVGIAYKDNLNALSENIIEDRAIYKGYKYLVDQSLFFMIAKNMNLPYWKCSKNIIVTEEDKNLIKNKLSKDSAIYMPLLEQFLFADGYSIGDSRISLRDELFNDKEVAILEKFKKDKSINSNYNAYLYLWENLNIAKAYPIIKLHKQPKKIRKKKGMIASLKAGVSKLKNSSDDDKNIVYYCIIAFLLQATFSTIFGVPYYALGIELAPSYEGRTKLVAIRAIFQKFMAFLNPWIMPICFLSYFTDGIEGMTYILVALSIIAIPTVIYSVLTSKERVQSTRKEKQALFTSIKSIIKNKEFWKITGLYVVIGNSLGIFQQIGMFVTIYYVFKGNMLEGSSINAVAGSLGVFIALISVPLVAWLCNKYQKHVTMRLTIITLMLGCALKWVCYNPEYPYLIFVMPFVFSLGISSLYTVLATLMADVTDLDELNSGYRREGMFGAVSSFIMKSAGIISTLASGFILALSGFNVELGVDQAPGVFTNLRLLFSFVPATLLLGSMFLLYKYPLTRERMSEIKDILSKRRAEAKDA